MAERILRIDGTRNLRDVGGYPVSTGGETRWGTLLRAEAFGELPEASLQQLGELGLRTVIDLREHKERRREGEAVIPIGARREFSPLFGGGVAYDRITGLGDLYTKMLDSCGPRVVDVIRLLQQDETVPAVIHCSAGKDRTGVVTAMILSAIGVPDQHVIDDYALTGVALTDSFKAILRSRSVASGWPEDMVDELIASPPEAMEQALEHLAARHGSAADYLLASGLSEDELDALVGLLVRN